MTDVLVKASIEGETIESTYDDLDAVPTGHTMRKYLNEQLRPEDLAEIEERINAALTADLPKRLWRIRLDLATDLHDEPIYGKTEELLAFACRGKAKATRDHTSKLIATLSERKE